jgi:REP element-mobilizing transposase RayT
MEARPLTDQQESVLAFVEQFSRERGFPPTLREIGDALGLPNINAVRGHLAALEKKGYITRAPDKARSIQVVQAPSAISRVKRKLHEIFHTDEGVSHRVIYGLAWTTRRREPVLVGACRDRLAEALERGAVEHGWTLLEVRIEPDHVVVVVQAWPNHSAQQTIHRFQSAGKAASRKHRREFPGELRWGRGYAVTTDLEVMEDLVTELLAGQTGLQGNGE